MQFSVFTINQFDHVSGKINRKVKSRICWAINRYNNKTFGIWIANLQTDCFKPSQELNYIQIGCELINCWN